MYKQKKKRAVPQAGRQRRKKPMLSRVSTKAMSTRPTGSVLPSKLQYAQSLTLNPGVGGVTSSNFFRLGSIFDPDYSGIGHQPLGHDQFALIFERYQVWKVDYHIEILNTDSSNPQLVGYRLSDTVDGVGDEIGSIENGQGEWTLLNIQGSNDRAVFTGSIKPCDVHGVSYHQYMSNDDYGATFGSNPSEDAYMVVFASGLGSDTGACKILVHLVYHTKLMGSKITATS